MYRWYFKPKNIKKIPFKDILLWLFLTALLILLFTEAFFLASKRLDSVQEKQITVYRIGFQSRPRGSRYLIVYTEDETYYISTGSFRNRDSVTKIYEDWENGTISAGDTVTVQYVDESRVPFRSFRYKNLIVGLQTEATVYYELDTAKKVTSESRVVMMVVFFLLLLVWTGFTYLFIIADNILVFRPSKKREIHKKYKKSK